MDAGHSELSYYRNNPRNIPHDINGHAIPGGPWLRINDVEGHKHGTYSSHHGKLALANIEEDSPEGRAALFLAPNTELNREILQKSGFRSGALYVPLSNGETPPAHAATFIEEMRKSNDTTLLGVHFGTKATGVQYTIAGNSEIKMVGKVTATQHLGTYNISRTGLIGIVDMEGVVYVAKDDGKEKGSTRAWLEEHGFHRSHTLAVPFAHGEKPIVRESPTSADPALIIERLQNNPLYQRGMREVLR